MFLLIINWYKYSKWIFDLVHLQSLGEVLSSIKFFAHDNSKEKIDEFLQHANSVIRNESHYSNFVLSELKRLLQEISDDPNIRQILGRNRPTIGGGTFFAAWSSGKMCAFLKYVMLFKNDPCRRRFPFSFNHEDLVRGMTSDDMLHHGHNCGRIYRVEISKVFRRGEVLYSKKDFANSKVQALTPRGTTREILMESPRRTPVATQRGTSSRTSTPLNLSRPQTPRLEHSAAPLDVYFFIQNFLSEHLLNFLHSSHSITGLDRSGPIWDLYSHLHGYTRNPYGVGYVIYNPSLQASFLQTLAGSELVKCALTVHLSKTFSDCSLATLRLQSKEQQERFFSILKTMVFRIAEWYCDQKNGDVFLYDCPQGGFWRQDPNTLRMSYLKPSRQARPYTIIENVRSA